MTTRYGSPSVPEIRDWLVLSIARMLEFEPVEVKPGLPPRRSGGST